jgi:hypothetical protein
MHPDQFYREGALVRSACHVMPNEDKNVIAKTSKHKIKGYDPDKDGPVIPQLIQAHPRSAPLAQTLTRMTIAQLATLLSQTDHAILPTRSSMPHSNTSRKSGKIKSISLSGPETIFGMSSKVLADNSHDSDNKYPRSPSHIYESNKHIRDKFYKIFKPDNPLYPLTIPIVPSYGNNDVWPYFVLKTF